MFASNTAATTKEEQQPLVEEPNFSENLNKEPSKLEVTTEELDIKEQAPPVQAKKPPVRGRFFGIFSKDAETIYRSKLPSDASYINKQARKYEDYCRKKIANGRGLIFKREEYKLIDGPPPFVNKDNPNKTKPTFSTYIYKENGTLKSKIYNAADDKLEVDIDGKINTAEFDFREITNKKTIDAYDAWQKAKAEREALYLIAAPKRTDYIRAKNAARDAVKIIQDKHASSEEKIAAQTNLTTAELELTTLKNTKTEPETLLIIAQKKEAKALSQLKNELYRQNILREKVEEYLDPLSTIQSATFEIESDRTSVGEMNAFALLLTVLLEINELASLTESTYNYIKLAGAALVTLITGARFFGYNLPERNNALNKNTNKENKTAANLFGLTLGIVLGTIQTLIMLGIISVAAIATALILPVLSLGLGAWRLTTNLGHIWNLNKILRSVPKYKVKKKSELDKSNETPKDETLYLTVTSTNDPNSTGKIEVIQYVVRPRYKVEYLSKQQDFPSTIEPTAEALKHQALYFWYKENDVHKSKAGIHYSILDNTNPANPTTIECTLDNLLDKNLPEHKIIIDKIETHQSLTTKETDIINERLLTKHKPLQNLITVDLTAKEMGISPDEYKELTKKINSGKDKLSPAETKLIQKAASKHGHPHALPIEERERFKTQLVKREIQAVGALALTALAVLTLVATFVALNAATLGGITIAGFVVFGITVAVSSYSASREFDLFNLRTFYRRKAFGSHLEKVTDRFNKLAQENLKEKVAGYVYDPTNPHETVEQKKARYGAIELTEAEILAANRTSLSRSSSSWASTSRNSFRVSMSPSSNTTSMNLENIPDSEASKKSPYNPIPDLKRTKRLKALNINPDGANLLVIENKAEFDKILSNTLNNYVGYVLIKEKDKSKPELRYYDPSKGDKFKFPGFLTPYWSEDLKSIEELVKNAELIDENTANEPITFKHYHLSYEHLKVLRETALTKKSAGKSHGLPHENFGSVKNSWGDRKFTKHSHMGGMTNDLNLIFNPNAAEPDSKKGYYDRSFVSTPEEEKTFFEYIVKTSSSSVTPEKKKNKELKKLAEQKVVAQQIIIEKLEQFGAELKELLNSSSSPSSPSSQSSLFKSLKKRFGGKSSDEKKSERIQYLNEQIACLQFLHPTQKSIQSENNQTGEFDQGSSAPVSQSGSYQSVPLADGNSTINNISDAIDKLAQEIKTDIFIESRNHQNQMRLARLNGITPEEKANKDIEKQATALIFLIGKIQDKRGALLQQIIDLKGEGKSWYDSIYDTHERKLQELLRKEQFHQCLLLLIVGEPIEKRNYYALFPNYDPKNKEDAPEIKTLHELDAYFWQDDNYAIRDNLKISGTNKKSAVRKDTFISSQKVSNAEAMMNAVNCYLGHCPLGKTDKEKTVSKEKTQAALEKMSDLIVRACPTDSKKLRADLMNSGPALKNSTSNDRLFRARSSDVTTSGISILTDISNPNSAAPSPSNLPVVPENNARDGGASTPPAVRPANWSINSLQSGKTDKSNRTDSSSEEEPFNVGKSWMLGPSSEHPLKDKSISDMEICRHLKSPESTVTLVHPHSSPVRSAGRNTNSLWTPGTPSGDYRHCYTEDIQDDNDNLPKITEHSTPATINGPSAHKTLQSPQPQTRSSSPFHQA